MNLYRSLWRKAARNVACILSIASLVLALAPHVPARATEQAGSWADDIDDMIAVGNYAEGEAVVAFLSGEDDVILEQASLPVDSLEPLMEVGTRAAGIDTSSNLTAQAPQEVTLTLVSSDTLTTEQILRSLASDARVAFAEPNYYLQLDDGEAATDDAQDEQPSDGAGTDAADAEAASEEAGTDAELDPADEPTPEAEAADEPTPDAEGVDEPTPELDPADEPAPEAEAADEPTPEAEAADAPETEAADAPETTDDSEATEGATELDPAADDPNPEATDPAADPDPANDLVIITNTDGPIGDLRELQWGNWDTATTGTKSLNNPDNVSINTPNFEDARVGANMDNEVVVAVLDGAVDFSNPDLVDRAYTFSPALQAQLGCDEHGFNASAESTDGKFAYFPNSSGEAHGTHCAGVIGASWDGRGISGVASNAKIVSIQVMGNRTDVENGYTSLGNALRGFDFIKRANEAGVGIKVTSNSWGFVQVSKALNAATYELGSTQGVISFFAAGNESYNNNAFPYASATFADNPYVTVIAASGQDYALTDFSNYGTMTVDLAAPGMSILSSVLPYRSSYIPSATPDTNIVFEDFEDGAPVVTIQQIDENGVLVSSPGVPTTDVHMSGSQGVEVPVDLSCNTGEGFFGGLYRTFRIDVDIAAAQNKTGIDVVESLKAAEDLYFGYAMCTDNQYDDTMPDIYKTNMTGDEEIEPTNPNTARCGTVTSIFEPLTGGDFTLDFDHLDGHLIIDVKVMIDEACPAVYFDSIGFGLQKIPYTFMNGTSMATPMAAGAAAVLSSQTGLEGAELASLVRSKVRVPQAGALNVRSGGIFDFNVDGSTDDGAEAFAPVIASLEVEGTTVTITGANFGSTGPAQGDANAANLGSGSGSVDIARYVVGNDDAEVAASVTSWSDSKVTLQLDAPFVGIMRVKLYNAAGKQDTVGKFVSKGETVYEQDLPFESETGEPFAFDATGDLETKGPLVGLGCKLYYLPVSQPTEVSPSYKNLYCFDLKTETWSQLPDLPEWLWGVSAVMYDGKIVVEGATTDILPSGEPTLEFVDVEPEPRVYVYDPSASSWTEASHEGMYLEQTLINDDGQLKLVGGVKNEYDEDGEVVDRSSLPVLAYDLQTGVGEEICPLTGFFKDPRAVAKDGVIYLFDAVGYFCAIVKDGHPEFYLDKLPDIAEVDESELLWGGQSPNDPQMGWGALAVCSEGVLLVGPPSEDGTTDTYILRDPDGVFEPYEKRATDARLQSVAACTYRGRLFAIGSSWVEPDQRLFRATEMDVPEYPGDIPCEPDPEPEPEPQPEPEPEPEPQPEPKPEPKPLPKTSDLAIPSTVLIGLVLVGLATMVAGILLSRRR